ncbi:hypothetical protein N7474_001172 [Penicillium riverlandense]|uniref:uncharacterized protein n=1 Tax=Penicillium riverlandense TaxID=1903569 RepID=UPI00254693FD|nr:uncharacterized protein N7474_001172 [Penicillium riverlandense]KAJ5832861.1 hypothetical protein N7474_001172 [Penicillium riverlandense]
MASHTIGVFPASGGIGGSTVKHLLPRFPAKDLVFVARDPAKLDLASAAGATVRQADYDDDKSLEHAFDGVETLFLISYPSVEFEHRAEVRLRCSGRAPSIGEMATNLENLQRHRAAINFALRSGVRYIFYGSLGFAGFTGSEANTETVAHVMRAHLDTEKHLEECRHQHPGFAYTIVREGLYSESYPLYTAFFNPRNPVDEIKIAHDGSGPGIAWVKREELGEGTAELLRIFAKEPKKFQYRNSTVLLSGSRALTLKETVEILAKIAKKPVRIRQVSDEEFARQSQVPPNFTYRGVDLSKPWATAFEAFRQGEASVASPLLRELLGREPEDFETTISQL